MSTLWDTAIQARGNEPQVIPVTARLGFTIQKFGSQADISLDLDHCFHLPLAHEEIAYQDQIDSVVQATCHLDENRCYVSVESGNLLLFGKEWNAFIEAGTALRLLELCRTIHPGVQEDYLIEAGHIQNSFRASNQHKPYNPEDLAITCQVLQHTAWQYADYLTAQVESLTTADGGFYVLPQELREKVQYASKSIIAFYQELASISSKQFSRTHHSPAEQIHPALETVLKNIYGEEYYACLPSFDEHEIHNRLPKPCERKY